MNKDTLKLFISIIAGLGLGIVLTYAFNANAIYGLKPTELWTYNVISDYGAVFNNLGGASDKVIITNAGNVGIGTASPGLYKLKVYGDMNVSGGTLLAQGSGALDSFKAYANNTNSALVAEQVNAGGYAVYSTGGKNYFQGNVGIGTSDPKSKLQVNNGYLQIPHLNSAPPAADCDDLSEKGRMTIYGGVGVRPAFAICASGAGNNLQWIYFQCVGYPTCNTAQ